MFLPPDIICPYIFYLEAPFSTENALYNRTKKKIRKPTFVRF